MQMHRRVFLSGVSAFTLYLFMPSVTASAKPEALSFIVKKVYECLKTYPLTDRYWLFSYCQSKTGTPMRDTDWLNKDRVAETVDRTLRAAFRAFRVIAEQEDFPLMHEGKLSFVGQVSILEHLPLAPMDYGNKAFMDALNSCTPYYLS